MLVYNIVDQWIKHDMHLNNFQSRGITRGGLTNVIMVAHIFPMCRPSTL